MSAVLNVIWYIAGVAIVITSCPLQNWKSLHSFHEAIKVKKPLQSFSIWRNLLAEGETVLGSWPHLVLECSPICWEGLSVQTLHSSQWKRAVKEIFEIPYPAFTSENQLFYIHQLLVYLFTLCNTWLMFHWLIYLHNWYFASIITYTTIVWLTHFYKMTPPHLNFTSLTSFCTTRYLDWPVEHSL